MKITLAQLNFTVGDVDGNTGKIIKAIKDNQSSDLVVFSELCIIGYPPLDLVYNETLIKQQQVAVVSIVKAVNQYKTDVVLGLLSKNNNDNQKPYYNSLRLIRHDSPEFYVQYKTLLPTYNIFNEDRYFEACNSINVVKYRGKNVVFAICEDLWGAEETVYKTNPLDDVLSDNDVDIVISINASPSTIGKVEDRIEVCKDIGIRHNVGLAYCNQVGSNDDIVFDGTSFFMNELGDVVVNAKSFRQDYLSINYSGFSAYKNCKVWVTKKFVPNKYNFIYKQLIMGIRDYVQKCGFKKVVIGSSGGIDSAVVMALATDALGNENVSAITMPNTGVSSAGSVNLSRELCDHLDIDLMQIPITFVFEEYIKTYKCIDEDLEKYGLTGQNLQARIRGAFLMMHSNQSGSMLLTTGNKSEVSVGYCTLYGDTNGGLAPIADLYKTEVYKLAEYINRDKTIIPTRIIKQAPSAELAPDQKDTDNLPPYHVLDKMLKLYIEGDLLDPLERHSLELFCLDLETTNYEIYHKICKMVDNNEFKRRQLSPTIRIHKRSFGSGRQLPIAQRFRSK